MKILYLTFYFEPDLGPGAFRNTTLVDELARQLGSDSTIHVLTTQPNRYQSYAPTAPDCEEQHAGGCLVTIERIRVPAHTSGLTDQIHSFWAYYRATHQRVKSQKYDLIVASSSRLFTAFLGAKLARKHSTPLFLDIRDIFREAILDVLKNPLLRTILKPLLRIVERYTFGYASHINLVSEGFRSYFSLFPQATYSYFTNGIDDAFLMIWGSRADQISPVKTLLYAGNIGEGQGLDKIIPQAARQLGAGYRFVIIGDGGAKQKLETAIRAENVSNVALRQPISRPELIAYYQNADYLFVHLNDLKACQRVLPSKLFEYGATDKPIVAGVAGYAASFVREQLPNSIIFNPGDVAGLVRQIRQTTYHTQVRTNFRAQFGRKAISQALARQILQTVKGHTHSQLHTPKRTQE